MIIIAMQIVNMYHHLAFASHLVVYAESIVSFWAIGLDPPIDFC